MTALRGFQSKLVETFVSDVSIPQYAAVVAGASDLHATLATAVNAGEFLGFALDSSVDSETSNGVGDSVPVAMVGTAWGIAAGAISYGDQLILAASGGQVQSVGAQSGPVIIGTALTTATAAGDIVLVKIA